MSSQPGPVLYAEDDENDVFLMQRAFQKVGVPNHLQIAYNGRQALDLISQCGSGADSRELPELIMLDLKMPQASGLEVLEKIRSDARLARIPVVILTSSIQEQDVQRARALGANGYLVKAPALAGLTETVADLRAAFLTGQTANARHLRGNRLESGQV